MWNLDVPDTSSFVVGASIPIPTLFVERSNVAIAVDASKLESLKILSLSPSLLSIPMLYPLVASTENARYGFSVVLSRRIDALLVFFATIKD